MDIVSTSKIKLLTLAYSVLLDDIKQERKVLNIIYNIKDSFINFYSEIEVVICIQGSSEVFNQVSFNLKKIIYESRLEIKLIYGGIKGLSISRNICIKALQTKYIHFLDCDCRFSIKDTMDFISFLKSQRINILFINSPKIIDNKVFSITSMIPQYSFLFLPQKLRYVIKSISAISYQIIISKYLLLKSNIFFDKNLGLGTNMNQSEEVCFLLSIFKSRAKISMAKYTLLNFYANSKSHLPNKENIDKNLLSKGYVIRKILGVKGLIFIPLISLIFYCKNKPYLNIVGSLKLVNKGFWSLDN